MWFILTGTGYWKTGHSLQWNELHWTHRDRRCEWKSLAAKSLTINLESSLRQYTPSNLWTNVERMLNHSFKCFLSAQQKCCWNSSEKRTGPRTKRLHPLSLSLPPEFDVCVCDFTHSASERISQLEPSWSVSVIIPRKNHWYNPPTNHSFIGVIPALSSTHIARELGDRPLNPEHGHPRPTEGEILLVRLSFDLVWATFINLLISLTLHIPS